MVRAPCCEKMGLKKGPWTSQEDHILISYINENGHGNWRALPKRAGLMRCGKSCRLRWMNYLRPDIIRGNFTRKEEETIMRLHSELGNKWSVIAAKLPGRTDNEIKNVWHTHLKKRLNNGGQKPPVRPVPESKPEISIQSSDPKEEQYNNWGTISPARTCSDVSSVSTAGAASEDSTDVEVAAGFLNIWSEDFPVNEWSGFSDCNWGGTELGMGIGNEFWYGQIETDSWEEFIELPEIW